MAVHFFLYFFSLERATYRCWSSVSQLQTLTDDTGFGMTESVLPKQIISDAHGAVAGLPQFSLLAATADHR